MKRIRLHRRVPLAASLGLSAIVLCGQVQTTRADWFQWMDRNGVTHLTDRQENIPDEYRAEAAALDIPATPPPLTVESVSIPLESEGQVAVVSALLNGRTAASLIVDTGATYTVISYELAGELQIDVSEDTPVTQLQTANGVITAPVVELESVDVGGMKLDRVKAAVHDLPTATPVGGLLGLNFLQHFRVDIDTTKRILSLERRNQP